MPREGALAASLAAAFSPALAQLKVTALRSPRPSVVQLRPVRRRGAPRGLAAPGQPAAHLLGWCRLGASARERLLSRSDAMSSPMSGQVGTYPRAHRGPPLAVHESLGATGLL